MKFENMINTIQLGNCYELIKSIPDKSIDCIYIDIPYLYDSYGKPKNNCGKRISEMHEKQMKNIINGIDYKILDEFLRVLKKINCFIWCSRLQINDILNYFIGKNCLYDLLVWCKKNPIPLANNSWLSDIEYCLYFREQGVRLNDGINIKSKWYISPINTIDKSLYKHPTIKPLELLKRHLLHATQENDLVLDCFCGSGTTCVAAKETGRRFIGMEINKEYYKIACDRLNGITADGQMSIFTDFDKVK